MDQVETRRGKLQSCALSRFSPSTVCRLTSVLPCLRGCCPLSCACACVSSRRRRILRLHVDYFDCDDYPLPPTNAATSPQAPPRNSIGAAACSSGAIGPGEHGVGWGSSGEYGGARPPCMRIAKEGVIVVLKCRATSADVDVADAYTASAPSGFSDVEDGMCGARLLGSAGPRGSFGRGSFLLWMGGGGRSTWTGRGSTSFVSSNLMGDCVGESRSRGLLRRLALRCCTRLEQVMYVDCRPAMT